jgi:hypothetical protein
LEKLANAPPQPGYTYREPVVESGVLAQTDLDNLTSDLQTYRRTKQILNDKVLELNVRNEIELSLDAIHVLESKGII